MRRTFLLTVTVVVLSAIAAFAVSSKGQAARSESQSSELPPSATATHRGPGVSPVDQRWDAAATGSITETIPALVLPAHRAALRVGVSGTLSDLPLGMGDRLSTGQIVARVEQGEIVAALKKQTSSIAAAGHNIDEAKAELELATYQHELNEKLQRSRSVTTAQFVESRIRCVSAAARLEAVKEQLAVARHQKEITECLLEKYEVVAPFAGRVTEVLCHKKQFVREGDPILWVESDEKRLKLHLPAQLVKSEDRVEVSAQMDDQWQVLADGKLQTSYNPDGSVTVLLTLSPTSQLTVGQILQVKVRLYGGNR